MFLFTFLLAAFITAAYYYFKGHRHPKNFPPGPTGYPIVGSMLQFGKNPLKCLDDWEQQYGNIVGVQLGSMKAVVLNGYDLIKEALSKRDFNDRPQFISWLWFVGGLNHGLLTSTGDMWDNVRRFSMKYLSQGGFFGSGMESQLQKDIGHWLSRVTAQIREENEDKGNVISLENEFYLPACNSMWKIMTGEEIMDFKESEIEEFRTAIGELSKRFWLPISNPIWFLPQVAQMFPELSGISEMKIALDEFHNLMDKHINYELEGEINEAEEPKHMVEAFLREIAKAQNDPNSHFHGENGYYHMKGLLRLLFFGTAVTVNNALEHTIFRLMMNPEVQRKMHQEIINVVGNSRLPCISDIDKMPYTNAVIQEVLRISSISPFSNFQMTLNDVHDFHGYDLPKGTVVVANLHGVNNDKKLWEEPDTFMPERFLQDHSKIPSFAPFSVGLRVCPGQNFTKHFLFLFVTMTFQRFWFEWDKTLPLPTKENILNVEGTSVFKFSMKFKPFVKRWADSW